MKNKGIISTILCLSIMTSSLALTGCGESETEVEPKPWELDGIDEVQGMSGTCYVIHIMGDTLVVYETECIQYSGDTYWNAYYNIINNGNIGTAGYVDSFITDDKEDAEYYYSKFEEDPNLNAVWYELNYKEKTR